MQRHKLVRLGERQGIQQHVIHNRKDSGVAADAERQRHNRDSREAGRLTQHTQPDEYILNHGFEQMSAHRFAAFFPESLIAAELDARAALGFGAGQPGTFQIVHPVLDMRGKLILYFVLSPRAMKESDGEGAKVSDELHIPYS